MTEIEMFRGAMIGGACGDALGYPLQELSVCRIQHKYGPFGLRTLVRNGQCGNLAPVKYADGTGHGRRTSVDRCKEIGRSRRAVPRLYALVLQPNGGGTAARAAHMDETAAS